eukprot:gene19417-biopygen42347
MRVLLLYASRLSREPPWRAVLHDGGRVHTDGRDKAELLVRTYAKNSRLETTDRAAETKLRNEIERRLAADEPTPSGPVPAGLRADFEALLLPFTATELAPALRGLKKKKAGGPDGIANEMLQHLGGKGKDPNAAKSYRPVSLTRCVAKLMERLVRHRLQYLIEKWNLLSHEQAGYRSRLSTEEQLVLITQSIHDVMERGEYTLMLAVDFTQAFDRAKRITARVRVGDQRSAARDFFEGFPQGTVLGPIFWDMYLDDIVDALREGVPKEFRLEVVLYADDITCLLHSPELPGLYKQGQRVLANLARWEAGNDALVSVEKTTATVFSLLQRPLPEAERPRLLYNDRAYSPEAGTPTTVEYAQNPKMLGLIFDETLNFKAHCTYLHGKLQQSAAVTARLSGKSWGCDRSTLRGCHLAYVQSKLEYGMSSFGPAAAPSHMHKLAVEQNSAACTISHSGPYPPQSAR